MGTVDQPKPSEPKSPVPDQQPLHPGGMVQSGNEFIAERSNPQTPEVTRDESGEEEHRHHGR